MRMLKEAGVDYEHISDMAELSQKCAVFGASGGNLAPPVIVDGDTILSQSTAVAMYIGTKYGFPVPAGEECKAVQIMEDIKDLFEGGISKNGGDAATLKTYLKGDGDKPARFAIFCNAIEHNIKGPYFFGDKLSYVDFFLTSVYGNSEDGGLRKLKEKSGADIFEPYPKIRGVIEHVRGLDSFKENEMIELPAQYGLKEEVLDAYVKL